MTPGSIKSKRLATLCILGWVLFNYPILSLFNREVLFCGIPLLYVFLFLGWGGLVFFMACVTMARPGSSPSDSGENKRPAGKRYFENGPARGSR